MAKLTLSSLILLALAFIVVVTVFVFSTVLHDYHTSAGRKSASLRSADMQDAVPKSILVLLQRSVVDNSKQCQRLYGIDETWAKWSTQSPCTIAAVVPKDESCHANQLSRIRLHEIISPNGQPLDPFMNLYLGARSSMAQANTLNWVVLANDHSFFLLDNVVKFLQPLDHRQLIYTGSKLAISYEKEALSFASGGAGAVLSMTALKALLTIWESIHRHQRTVRSEGVLPPRITPNDKIFVARTTRDLEDFSSHAAKLIHAVAFRQQHASFDQVPQVKLSMYISSLYHIELAITEDLSAVVWELHNATHTLSSIEHGKLMALCWPSSKWERDNPGIILSTCLQRGLRVPFTESTVEGGDHICRERFHCYGPVRMMMGDVDDWFVKAKQLGYREERCGDAYKHPGGPICSFHYVETAEARVLYHLLDHALYSSNAAKILEMWPSNGSALGGYSRKLASLNEAEMLKSYISVIDF